MTFTPSGRSEFNVEFYSRQATALDIMVSDAIGKTIQHAAITTNKGNGRCLDLSDAGEAHISCA